MASWWRTSPAARWLVAAVIVVVLAVTLPGGASPGFLTVGASLLVTAQLVMSVDLVFASIKQMSLVHAALMGTAAYLMLGLQSEQHWSFWEAFGGSVIGCVGLCAIIATFIFRASGYYFAILTFVISEIIVLAFNNLAIAGGSGGLFFFTQGRLFGVQLGSDSGSFEIICIATLLIFGYVWLIRRSRLGRQASAVGDNEALARAVGMPVTRTKQLIFIASGLPTAIAGALYATSVGAIQPSLFDVQLGVAAVLMALLGGSGYLAGPLIGAAIYIGLPEIIPINPEVATGIVGLLFVVLIRVSPDGIAAGATRIWRYLIGRLGKPPEAEGEPVPAPALNAGPENDLRGVR
ncbi:MAG TPA: branched-chain amino acid ABC transporter permease [Streptosporangiaceae bacterium]|jgi:branched-chain amino acid transport system permease protein